MKMNLFLALLLLVPILGLTQEEVGGKKDEERPGVIGALFTPDPDKVLGEILKGILERYHLTQKELDDDLSKKAYDVYLEQVDFGKQFLTNKDLKKLSKLKYEFDDQLTSGDLSIVNKTTKIMDERIPYIQKHVKELLKKDFDYTKKENYESDPEKRKFAADEKDLKERWRKLIKLEVLIEYFEIKDEQDGIEKIGHKKDDKKDKKKKVAKNKKDKKEKKLNKKEMYAKAREKVQKRYDRIFKRLLEQRRSDRLEKFYNAITLVYDPHTKYFPPEEKEDFDIDMSGKLEGIGALLREEGSYIKVERIIPGSASWKGKELKAEDTILAVGQEDADFVDVVDMSIRDAVKLIRGPKGTVVKLKVKRPDGAQQVISIVRDEVVLEEAYVKTTILEHKDLGKKIGYIHVPKFYRDFQNADAPNSSDDVKKALIELKKAKVDGVILNLRNNGGGALTDATLMGGLFIDSGPIVQVKSNGKPDVKRDIDGKTYWDKPVIVLVNRFSASASEIVAGALKDYKRALIVGSSDQTHGKGTVQAILDVKSFVNPFGLPSSVREKLGAIKITTDMFYRVNGMSTQFRGVEPDIVLPDQYGYLETGEKSLDYAIPYDETVKQKYKEFKQDYSLGDLKVKSKQRVAKNEKFQKIIKSVAWSKERRESTERSLVYEDMEKYRKESREMSEKFEIDQPNEKVQVISVKKLKNDVEKASFDDFKEELQTDPVIEETLHIFSDMLASKEVAAK